jgi:hypothetical protein
MFIILSSAYVSQEIQYEVGYLPPAMLPLGPKRLYEYIVEKIEEKHKHESIIISLPTKYKLDEIDKIRLKAKNIKVIRISESKSIAEAIYIILEKLTDDVELYEPLKIIYGDTYIEEIPEDEDCLGVARSSNRYDWDWININKEDWAICGYFAISSTSKLKILLRSNKLDFINAVKRLNLRSVELEWYDFGHLNTYLNSRIKFANSRSFNRLHIENNFVHKCSIDTEKIEREACWFEALPNNLKKYTPRILRRGNEITEDMGYEVEYVQGIPLNENFINGNHGLVYWKNIFKKIGEYIGEAQAYKVRKKNAADKNYQNLLKNKTHSRLIDYLLINPIMTNVQINDEDVLNLNEVVDYCIEKSLNNRKNYGAVHGDLCLSNIIYDARIDKIKIIDPRGSDCPDDIIGGVLNYDYSKLNHSLVGYYDVIISDNYDLDRSENKIKFQLYVPERIKLISAEYLNSAAELNFSPKDYLSEQVLLFLSMLPLHAENERRQLALLANALRIFKDLRS